MKALNGSMLFLNVYLLFWNAYRVVPIEAEMTRYHLSITFAALAVIFTMFFIAEVEKERGA